MSGPRLSLVQLAARLEGRALRLLATGLTLIRLMKLSSWQRNILADLACRLIRTVLAYGLKVLDRQLLLWQAYLFWAYRMAYIEAVHFASFINGSKALYFTFLSRIFNAFPYRRSHELHLSTLDNGHVLVRLVPGRAGIFNHPNNIHAIHDLPKHNMFSIQEWSWCRGDEKLTSIGIGARILGRLVSPYIINMDGGALLPCLATRHGRVSG